MGRVSFRQFFESVPVMLGEGAVIERLRRDTDFSLDPYIVNSAFIYEAEKRAALEKIYREYLDAGSRFGLPLVLSTPTWRASQERIADAGYAGKDVNGDNFRFLDDLRNSYGAYGGKVVICGLMSCQGDAYDPSTGLSSKSAQAFHRWQAEKLAGCGVDFILAATLPALEEATGLAAVIAATNIPYIVSFVARPEGTMLDGTPLAKAIGHIDETIHPKPMAFMINCTHASIFASALRSETNSSDLVRNRVCGLFANTAALNPEELNDCDELVSEAPEVFGESVAGLKTTFGMKILGGCCGTDGRHIHELAKRLVE